MKLIISAHAEKEIKRRNISKSLIHDAFGNPDEEVKGYGGRKVKQKIHKIKGKEKLLRVIYEVHKGKGVIVTAYLTSQIKKYMESKNEN